MKRGSRVLAVAVGLVVVGGVGAAAVFARPGAGPPAHGGMCGPGMGPGGGHGGDMMAIHALFARRDQIRRTVSQIPGGVRTTTESDDPAVASQLREHVQSMYARLESGRPINARDPLFAAIFENADKIHVKTETTAKGITVTETSDDPEVAALVRRHAEVVNRFIANGMPEMMRTH